MFEMRRCNRLPVIALAVSAASGVTQLRAIEASDILVYSKEPVMLKPRLAITSTYNDNIFSRPGGTGDFLTTISPGLKIQVGRTSRNYISLEYTLSENFYADRSDLNSGEHTFDLRLKYQKPRLNLTGNDRIQFFSSPVGSVEVFRPASGGPEAGPAGNGLDNGVGGGGPGPDNGIEPSGLARGGEVLFSEERNVDRTVAFDAYGLGYGIGEKTGVYIQGLHSSTDYQQGVRNLLDINTLKATAGFTYQAFPKTSFFGELFYGQTGTSSNVEESNNPNVKFVGGFVGAKGRFTEKIAGVARVGYQSSQFDDGTSPPSSPVVDISLGYSLSPKTAFSLDYSRAQEVSIQFVQQIYTTDSVTFQVSQAFGSTGKWRASAGGNWSKIVYEESGGVAGPQYDRFSANFSLAYQLQLWLNVNFGYSFDSIKYGASLSSNYDINRVTLGLAIGY
jgi:hypothetical protein